MNLAKNYDVVIVGAGPSGSTLARLLASSGFSILLLEKEKFPRLKPCGGLISARALLELDFKVDEVTKEIYRKAKIFRPQGDFFELESHSPIAIGVSRAEFDNFLVEKAVGEGACFEDAQMVRRISVTSEKAEIVTSKGLEVASKIAVGADGVNGIVARIARIRGSWQPSEVATGLVSEIKLGRETVREICPDPVVEFHFGIGRTGYGWIFPKGEDLNIGVGGLLSEQKNTRELFNSFIQSSPRLRCLSRFCLRSHLLPIGGIDRHICADRTLLIGDAGGFVDPLSGEGIFYAILSAKEASRIIIKRFDEDAFSKEALLEYERNCEKSIVDELRHAYSFARKVHYHPNIMLRFFIVDRKLQMSFVSLLRGETTYKQFTQSVYHRVPITVLKSIVR